MNTINGKIDTGAISKKIIFCVPVQTMSPLRIASGKTDNITDILILKNNSGNAFIPATSLAGVLRSELYAIYGKKVTDLLFGNSETGNGSAQSILALDDVELKSPDCQKKEGIITRDGVHIHKIAGTGIDGQKYNFEAVERGACGELFIEMTIRKGHEEKVKSGKGAMSSVKFLHPVYEKNADVFLDAAATIADILTNGIHVGSLTTKGLGLVRSTEPARFYLFDFEKSELEVTAADAWLRFVKDNKLPAYEYVTDAKASKGEYPSGDFAIEAQFAIKSSLLVRDTQSLDKDTYDGKLKGDSTENKSKPAAVPMKSLKDFVIPGTSIKGALRAKAYKILLSLSERNEEVVETFLAGMMGYADNAGIYNGTDNEKGHKSKFNVDEIYFAEEENRNVIEVIKQSRNRIDRFTGGTIKSALFTEFAVWQKDKQAPILQLKMRVKGATHAEAGLMLLLLRDLWLGNLPLGGGKAIGRGILQGFHADIYYEDKQFVIKQKLPVENNNGKIDISGKDADQQNLTDFETKKILQTYVSELVEYLELAGEQI